VRVAVIANMRYGLESFVYREIAFLSRQGWKISLFPTRCQSGLYRAQRDWEVHPASAWKVALLQVYCLLRRPRAYLGLLRDAVRLAALREFALAWTFSRRMAGVDVVYATFGDRKLFTGYFCKRILGVPLAVTIHAYELYNNPNPRLFRAALEACDQVITVTEHNREVLRDAFGLDPNRVAIVRYGVDLDFYAPARPFVILIVSFFTQRKGHDVLLEAVKAWGRRDVEVWVVGTDGGRKNTVDVRAMAAELGLDGQVAFFGPQSGNALRALYRQCDVFCLPCRKDSGGCFEGFPNVLIEAMASAKPVITTRHVEIPRIIPEIIVEENDVAGLVAALEEVYRSPALRARLGAQNRGIAEQRFPARNAARTGELLRQVAARPTLDAPGDPGPLVASRRAVQR
jgi:glycosyltransferase involved in cell wall biosynthesis